MNTVWIKQRMRALKITQTDLAKEIGISVPAVNKKLHNLRPTTLTEAVILVRRLKMTATEVKKHIFDESPF